MKDQYGRIIEYMRVSITDRCNLRCKYCMPDGCEKVSMSRILTYEDMMRICEAAAGLGIKKYKVTGGEPLVRLGCADFISELKKIPGVEEVTMTTNGIELEKYMPALVEAGLDAVNVSLDSLKPERFKNITGGGLLEKTLAGIDASIQSGIKTKVNCLLQKGFNEDEMLDFAEFAFDKAIDVRFIEMMPVGFGDPGTGLSNVDVLRKLQEHYPELEADASVHGNGPAVYYKMPGRKGGIGFINALHGMFCSSCNRIRLTSQGMIKPCLCYEDGVDIKPYLQGSIADIQEGLKEAILSKPGQHCFNEDVSKADPMSMSGIGG